MVIATERFEDLARQSARRAGLDGARIVRVAHPIGGVVQDELSRKGEAATEDVISRFLGS